MELTSLDLSLLMNDLDELENGHVQKVYQRKDELTLEVYVGGEGKKRVIIGPNHVFLSKYKRDNPQKPPGFAMELRKHLGRITSIEQRGFDRILEIESGDTKLICEVYGRGNFVLTKDNKIIGALREEEWADRTIRVGEEYSYPEPTFDPRDTESHVETLGEGEVVRKIASDLSLGGVYAEEICERTGIDKHKAVDDLEEDEKTRLDEEINEVLFGELSPQLYIEDEDPVRASPFELQTYSEYDTQDVESFSEALDTYFYIKEKRKEEKKLNKAYRERKEGLEAQLEQQKRKIQGLEKSSEQNRETAEKIYENYQELEEIKEMVEEALDKYGWKETEKRISESETSVSNRIKGFNEQERFYTVKIDGETVKLKPGDNLEATASRYYDKAKDSESKIKKVKKAKEETEKQLDGLEKEEIDIEDVLEDKTQKRSKKWFEKYRWFYSSEGYLVLCGRDSQTNDMLVKKHMESNDLYFHADFDGAPSVVIKDGQDSGEETRQEAAKASITFSKTWKAGIGSDNVYYVAPDQVSQEPEPGEYLPKGAFIVRGDRNYLRNVKVEAAVGVYEVEEDVYVPVSGPVKAIEENCLEHVEIKPGRSKKSEVAKEIRSRFDDYDIDLDYIIRVLPPGKSSIKS